MKYKPKSTSFRFVDRKFTSGVWIRKSKNSHPKHYDYVDRDYVKTLRAQKQLLKRLARRDWNPEFSQRAHDDSHTQISESQLEGLEHHDYQDDSSDDDGPSSDQDLDEYEADPKRFSRART